MHLITCWVFRSMMSPCPTVSPLHIHVHTHVHGKSGGPEQKGKLQTAVSSLDTSTCMYIYILYIYSHRHQCVHVYIHVSNRVWYILLPSPSIFLACVLCARPISVSRYYLPDFHQPSVWEYPWSCFLDQAYFIAYL